MSSHTPGPWVAKTFQEIRHPTILGPNDSRSMIIGQWDGVHGQGLAHTVGLGDGIDHANAILIAAAPQLLQACEKAKLALDNADETLDDLDCDHAYSMIVAAIAKARDTGP